MSHFAAGMFLLHVLYCIPMSPGRVAQSVGHLTRKSWVRYPVWQYTFVSPSAFSRRAVVSYWRKYVHEVLVNRLGGLSLPRKSVVRLTGRPDMTLDVYRGRKTTIQQQQQQVFPCLLSTDLYYATRLSIENCDCRRNVTSKLLFFLF